MKTMRCCVAFIFVPLVILLAAPAAPAGSAASIIAFDRLTQPDRSVRLSVRLVTGGLSFVQRPISGERIEFRIENRSLGLTLTGGDGVAVEKFTPVRPGLYRIQVRLVDNPRYEAEPVELVVACRPDSDPVFLVHLSSVRAPAQPPAIPFSAAPTAEAMPQAAEVLAKLSRRYQLVYLETGPESLWPVTKAWLESQDFPRAPLFVWPLSGEGAERTEQFAERIREMKEGGRVNLAAGIGRSIPEAEGFLKMKAKALVMTEADDHDEDSELPEGARKVTSWKAVPAALKER